MIEKINIRNFLSFKNVEVNLGKVNLLIGANNSGKSNFLKAFIAVKDDLTRVNYDIFLKKSFKRNPKNNIAIQLFGNKEEVVFQEIFFSELLDETIPNFINIVALSDNNYFLSNNNDLKTSDIKKDYINNLFFAYYFKSYIAGKSYSLKRNDNNTKHKLSREIEKVLIYDVDVKALRSYANLNPNDIMVNSDASNLVSFLDNMRDERPDVIKKIEESLKTTISNFRELRFKKASSNQKILGLADIYGNIFWADELSDGTLYFLAILSIIHQPTPPKLLLLEEPEKNIHPKRIHEVVDFLFQLSEEKDIQIIMTTHSPIIVDEFKDIPECVHLFDFTEGKSNIQNAAEVIKNQNEDRIKKEYSLLDYTNSTLGEQWVMGFLGGVPTK